MRALLSAAIPHTDAPLLAEKAVALILQYVHVGSTTNSNNSSTNILKCALVVGQHHCTRLIC